MKLSELWNSHRELFGNYESIQFPLLIKIIDAENDLIGIIFAVMGGVAVIVFAEPLIELFIGNGNEAVMALSKQYLTLNVVFYAVLALLFVYRNAMQGISRSTGHNKRPEF